MNKRDLFEQNIKNAVEDFDAPMDTSAWEKIEQQLPSGAAKGINGLKGWVAGAIIVAATATGYWYFSKPSTIEDKDLYKNEKIEQIEIKTIENDKIEKSIYSKESQDIETVDEVANQEDVALDQKESKVISNDSEDTESTNITPKEEVEGKELNPDESERVSQESFEADENLMVNWIISKNVLCAGEELEVSINNVNEPVELIWDFGDGETSKDPEVYHSYKEPGTYTIKLKANSLISDKKVYREKKYIDVKANPQGSFSIIKSENMAVYPEVEFNNLTSYYNHVEWVFPDDRIENKNSIKKLYRYKGRYQVGLIVTNHFGCKDSIYKDLVIEEDYNLLAINTFTPNDDGLNDTFLPEALVYLNKDFSMQVIDTKSGRLVFETQNIESPWNGKLNNSGDLLEGGLYAWTVKFEDGSVYSGTIKLITD